jgi:hypothetical protein
MSTAGSGTNTCCWPRQERVETAAAAAQVAIAELHDLQLVDDLLAREGILHQNPQTPADIEANFKRSQRRASLAMHVVGEDRGSEGRQYGLIELILEHKSA